MEKVQTYQTGEFEEKTTCIALAEKFGKNGFTYELIKRLGDVAIYSQSDNGKLYAYEVYEIRKRKGGIFNGKPFPPREVPPRDSEWGNNAFTVHTLAQAEIYMQEILSAI